MVMSRGIERNSSMSRASHLTGLCSESRPTARVTPEHDRADGGEAERLQRGDDRVGDVLPDPRVVEDVPHLRGEMPLVREPHHTDTDQRDDASVPTTA